MFHLELGGNGEHQVMPELIKQSIECLEDQKQRDFINYCLQADPKKRPTAKQLLFHPLLFEVPSLRLLAAHQIIKHQNESKGETCDADFRRPLNFVIATLDRNYKEPTTTTTTTTATTSESNSNDQQQQQQPQSALSSSTSSSTSNSSNSLSSTTSGNSPTTNPTSNPLISTSKKQFDFKYSNLISSLAHFEANKYLEDVKNGIYPLTAYGLNDNTTNTNQQTQINNKQKQLLETNINNTNDQQDSRRTLLSVNSDVNSSSLNPSAISPSNTSVSGASTSVANISSANLSSTSSSSSTSPSQSLTSQVNIQQQQQQQQQNELPIINNQHQHHQDVIEQELVINSQQKFSSNYNNNSNIDSIIYSSPSVSPPPPPPSIHLKQHLDQIVHNQNNNNNNLNGLLSRTQSPITMQTNGAFNNMPQSSPTPPLQQNNQLNLNDNNKPGENNNNLIVNETNLNVEKRHAKKMDWYIVCIEKSTNYKVIYYIKI